MHDPATGEVLATLASATSEDAIAALDAADAAQAFWAQTAPRVRAEILRRAFDLVTERAEDFALLMTLEMGKPLAEARGEVTFSGSFQSRKTDISSPAVLNPVPPAGCCWRNPILVGFQLLGAVEHPAPPAG